MTKPKPKITAEAVVKLLCCRHNKDICVPQCKTGGSWGGGRLNIMDLWVMKTSWTQPTVYAYEVKVSRADFMQDDKWPGYLEYCNEFYFAAPPGVIDPKELPPEAGLLITSKNGKKIYRKKKAAYRAVEIPEDLFRYILMWRAEITRARAQTTKREEWELWLKEKKYTRDLGYSVSRALAETIKNEIEAVRSENDRLQSRIEDFCEMEKLLVELGLEYPDAFSLKRAVTRRLEIIPKEFVSMIGKTINTLRGIKEICEKVKNPD